MLSMHCLAHHATEQSLCTPPLPLPRPMSQVSSGAWMDVALPAGFGRRPALPLQRACSVTWRLRWGHNLLTGGPKGCQWGGGHIDQLQPSECPVLHALHCLCLQSAPSLR